MSWQEVCDAVLSADLAHLKKLGPCVLECRSNTISESALHLAIKRKKTQVIHFLLSNYPALVEIEDDNCDTALDYAIQLELEDIVRKIIKMKPGVTERQLAKALQIAVENNKLSMVQIILKTIPKSVHIVSIYNETLLHFAAQSGYDAMVQYMLFMVPKHMINVQTKYGYNALHYAVAANNLHAVQLLHAADPLLLAMPNIVNSMTPFLFALSNDHPEIVDFFLSVAPNVVDQCQRLPGNALFTKTNAENMKKLLQIKPSLIDGLHQSKDTPLHFTVRHCEIFCVHLILLHKPSLISVTNALGETPLQIAIDKGRVDVIKLLLKHFPDDQERDMYDNNLLHIAVYYCEADGITLLLKNYSHLANCANKKGMIPFQLAVAMDKMEAANLLLPFVAIETLAKTNCQNIPGFQTYIDTQLEPLSKCIVPVLQNIVLHYVGL